MMMRRLRVDQRLQDDKSILTGAVGLLYHGNLPMTCSELEGRWLGHHDLLANDITCLYQFLNQPLAMHLMYTLDESGNRMYTLKVSEFIDNMNRLTSTCEQKTTEAGRLTKSAHPGTSLPSFRFNQQLILLFKLAFLLTINSLGTALLSKSATACC
jgi:hypothetical protein